jgi:hypothetical protein
MGLSIHYCGTIKDTSLIPRLVDEVKDICITLQWHYHLFDDELVKGICFSPPECEPLFFTFSKKGVLCSPVLLQYDIHPATTISVKTQFAGIEVHKAVIKLLRHLKANYFSEFELSDEGGYWESNDEKVLQKQFDNYEFILDTVCEALQDFKSKPNETAESLADRLEKFLNERLKKS